MSIFFWYFQARNNPDKAPTSIYISGGPGASSFDETNGFPCSFNPDGNSTRLNEQSWNEEVNMLYVDQPVGAGFSYSKIVNGVVDLMDSLSEDGSFFRPGSVEEVGGERNVTVAGVTMQSLDPREGVNTTQQAARVMWWFGQVWFQEFPGYDTSNKEISLWTVSYGGFYGPAFMAHFHRQSSLLPSPSQPNSLPLSLSTLGIQNGCLDVLTMGLSYLDFSVNNTYGIKAYPDEIYTAARTNLTEFCQPLLLSCRRAAADGDPLGYGNNGTVNQACALAAGVCFGFVQGAFTSYSSLNPFDITLSHPETFPGMEWVGYFNQDWVQATLGVPVNFTSGSRSTGGVFFAMTGDPMRHDLSDLRYVLQNGIKVAMVYGDLDYRCNWFGGEEISLAVGGDRFKEAGYAELKVGDRTGGMVREVEGLSFVRVFDAGHSVYTYQPVVVNEIFKRVMDGRDVATGEEEVGGDYRSEGPGDIRGLKVEASQGRDAGCFLADVGRTCDGGQIEALQNGKAKVVDGKVVEPGRQGAKGQDGQGGDGKGGEEKEQVKTGGSVKGSVTMAAAVVSMDTAQMPMKMVPPRSTRSKRGCITCRIRRVKCDETRPQCTRCTKAGRTCDGYAATSSQLSGRELATAVKTLQVVGPAARVLGEAVLTEDSACFDFFRMCTVAMTSTAFPAPFWSRHVLQVAHSEPAVWKAAVAVGALHRRWESRSKIRLRPRPINSGASTMPEDFTNQAMQQYWGAISMARTIQDPSVLMVMSVILAAAANMAGEWAASHVHIQSGLRLVASQSPHNNTMSSEIASIAQSLSRLDVLVMTFEDSRAPYAYVDPSTGKIPSSILHMPRVGKLDDLMQASMHLFGMFRYFLSVEGGYIMGFVTEEELPHLQARVTEDITRWKNEFLVLASAISPLASKAEQTTLLSLELYHSVLSLMSRAGISGPAVRWDAYTDEFARVIFLCETINENIFSPLPFFMSLEPGLVMPLFLAITRCRHPLVRRRALRLLKSLNRQEGMWNSPAACVVAEQQVLAEEEHLEFPLPLYIENLDDMPMEGPTGEGWEGSMAPEALRVTRDQIEIDVVTGRIELRLFAGLGEGEREIKRLSMGY
ncbi:putative carboxypeptidase [Cercophora samala]|uniref:Carboxypeptidase n=1 Tax=Cercophora samala TaxID=330535 RepID=A0AA39Z9D3_9PEZI|nr:putative carboxypeptidase [Cercophora samala]